MVHDSKRGSYLNFWLYGDHELKIVGTFEAEVQASTGTSKETFYVMEGNSRTLIASDTVKRMKMLIINATNNCSVNRILSIQANIEPLNQIKGILLEIPIDDTPVQQPYRRIPIPLEEVVERKLRDMVASDIVEAVDGPVEWVSPMLIVPRPKRLCFGTVCTPEMFQSRTRFPRASLDGRRNLSSKSKT